MTKKSNGKGVGEEQARRLSAGETLLSVMLRTLPVRHGKHRLLDHIAPRVLNKSGKAVSLQVRGHRMVIDPGDLVGWHYTILRSFDPEVVETLDRVCSRDGSGEVFWDIGANKGVCSYSLAMRSPLLRIVAIEPQASLATRNTTNLDSLCAGRYRYVQAGLGDEEAELTLVIPKDNLGAASLHRQQRSPDDRCEVIRIMTAQQVMESSGFGWPTVVKIDVEGHEPQVFRSLEPCISSGTCKAIVFENHPSETEAFDSIRSLVVPCGYGVYAITKSIWATSLVRVEKQAPHVTDYAVIRGDVAEQNKRIRGMMVSSG